MKTENIKKENAGLMESLELRTVRGRERERERERERNTEKLYYKKCSHFSTMCVFNTHFYTSPLED